MTKAKDEAPQCPTCDCHDTQPDSLFRAMFAAPGAPKTDTPPAIFVCRTCGETFQVTEDGRSVVLFSSEESEEE